MDERVKKAAEAIRSACGTGEVGLILGSGLSDSISLGDARVIPYTEIPDFPVSTVPGHRSEWVSGMLGGKHVHMMRGRFHYYEGYSPEDIVLPVRAMSALGVKTLIVTNAAGGVNQSFLPGDLMLIRDHINYSGVNPLMGKNGEAFGARFIDMTQAYDASFALLAHSCADELGIGLRDGVYMWFSGPSYETPAEIRMARILGADAVGMSTVPEVIAARQCGIRVLGITCITNMAAGVQDRPLCHSEVVETGRKVKEDFAALIGKIVEAM